MHHERLVTGVAAVFAGIAVVLGLTALVTSPAVFFVALFFAAAAYLLYDQISGRMAARVYRRVEQHARANGGGRRGDRGQRSDVGQRGRGGRTQSAGFGAGPRERWEPPRGGQSARDAAAGEAAAREGAARRAAAGGTATGQRRTAGPRNRPGPSPADRAAYETLGVDPGADEETVRQAYRERVKEVHPDAPSGSEERFKAVKDAYEQLTE